MTQASGLNIVDDSTDFLPPLPLDDELADTLDQAESSNDPQPGPSRSHTRRRSASRSPSIPCHEQDDAITRERKKRKLNEDREARLKAIAMRDEREQEELAGQSDGIVSDRDEAPNVQTLALMSHTLTSLRSAANPQVLEMRIMTHHAQDERFGFLRSGGRWHEVWTGMKLGTVGADGKQVIKEEKKLGLGGLAGDYGDSESEDDDDKGPSSPPPLPTAPPPPSPPRSPPPLPGSPSPPPPPLPSTESPS